MNNDIKEDFVCSGCKKEIKRQKIYAFVVKVALGLKDKKNELKKNVMIKKRTNQQTNNNDETNNCSK